MQPTDTLQHACSLLTRGDDRAAGVAISRDYPFLSVIPVKRQYSVIEATRIFVRDGFIDRYSGERLVFPGTLRLLALKLPSVFPYHPNWKVSATHPAFWQLYPTIDHVVPVARGGADAEQNWVSTSQLHNSAKAHWLLAELGWSLHPPGNIDEWDGLMSWFKAQVEAEPELTHHSFVRTWLRAAKGAAD